MSAMTARKRAEPAEHPAVVYAHQVLEAVAENPLVTAGRRVLARQCLRKLREGVGDDADGG